MLSGHGLDRSSLGFPTYVIERSDPGQSYGHLGLNFHGKCGKLVLTSHGVRRPDLDYSYRLYSYILDNSYATVRSNLYCTNGLNKYIFDHGHGVERPTIWIGEI